MPEHQLTGDYIGVPLPMLPPTLQIGSRSRFLAVGRVSTSADGQHALRGPA